jgi:hypothetical protein
VTPTPTPNITSSVISTSLGADSSGDYLVNPDSNLATVSTTINVSSPSLVEYVVIGLKPVSSASFYDWGRAAPSNSNATWTRSPEIPTINPAPVCTDGVSSKVMWEVKYMIRLRSGSEIFGVLPSKIARVLTGVYCPVGLYPMFGTSTGTPDGFTVQVSNFDASFQWNLGNAVRSDLTLNGNVTTSINSTGLITVGGLKPGVSAGITVTTTRSGYPTKMSAVAGQSLP